MDGIQRKGIVDRKGGVCGNSHCTGPGLSQLQIRS